MRPAHRPSAVVLTGLAAGSLLGGLLTSRSPGDAREPSGLRLACDAVSDRDAPLPGVRIDTGEYALSLVATRGPSSGASVQGRLWLRPTSALDTSPQPLEHALARDAGRVPLYGAAAIDFGGVGAPALPVPGSPAPDPRSFDPRRPGVLVAHDTAARPPASAWTVLIGTTANVRDTGCGPAGPCPGRPEDGVGVRLAVRKIEGGAFAGGWLVVGRADPGGFFCAVPVRYYPGGARRRHIP